LFFVPVEAHRTRCVRAPFDSSAFQRGVPKTARYYA